MTYNPDWVRRVNAGLKSPDPAMSCPHVHGPGHLVATSWMPGVWRCLPCERRAGIPQPPSGACDNCGTVSESLTGHGLWPVLITGDDHDVRYRLCLTCHMAYFNALTARSRSGQRGTR